MEFVWLVFSLHYSDDLLGMDTPPKLPPNSTGHPTKGGSHHPLQDSMVAPIKLDLSDGHMTSLAQSVSYQSSPCVDSIVRRLCKPVVRSYHLHVQGETLHCDIAILPVLVETICVPSTPAVSRLASLVLYTL